MTRVLVTDGENRSALAVVRSLGRKGCEVIVTGKSIPTLASSSRFCQRGRFCPDPLSEGLEYIRRICDIVFEEEIDVIFPMTEESIGLLNSARGQLPVGVVLACPRAAVMKAVLDKSSLFHMAEELDVPVPLTYYLASSCDLADVVDSINCYPVVVKSALSKIPSGDTFLTTNVKYATSKRELKQVYETCGFLRYPSMIQERIEGPGTGLFSLFDTNRHLALFSHQRLREKPPWGGVSVVSVSIQLQEEMVEAAGRLLSAVGWDGVAMVEFKRDVRDGKAKLMEINGRFWGSLQLAIACGIDFPALLLDHLQGRDPQTPIDSYRVGHKLKWFLGDLDRLLIRLKNCGEGKNFVPNLPSRIRSVIDFMNVFEREASFDVFDPYDLRPFFLEGIGYVRHALGRK